MNTKEPYNPNWKILGMHKHELLRWSWMTMQAVLQLSVRLHGVILLDCYECILTLAALTLHLI
jgi:hypothetical protein